MYKRNRAIAKLHKKEDNGLSIGVRFLNLFEMSDTKSVIRKTRKSC